MVALLLLLAISGGGWSGASAQDLLGFEDIQHASAPFHQMSKRDLEFNQYVPAFRLRGEPSCEELRAMWRYSKREARRATSTNQIPRTRPYRYGRLRPFAPYGPRNHIYGTMVLDNRHLQNYRDPFYKGAFNKLRAMVGPRRTGAFNDLRKLVGSERKEGETSTGQLKNLLNMRLKEVAAEENVRDNGVEQPSVSRRRDPTLPIHPFTFQKEGFTETLLPGNPKLAYYQQQLSEPDKSFSDSRNCLDVHMTECATDSQCSCDGHFMCANSRCLAIPQALVDQFGVWYYQSLPEELLGDWPEEG